MTHAHITSWLLALILFLVAIGFHKKGNEKAFKIIQMVLRVVYLLIVTTGLMLLLSISSIGMLYILKAAVGLWVIGMLEIILIRTKKYEKVKILWMQLAVAILLVLYLGFSLPLGFDFF